MKIVCPNCGAENYDSGRSCNACGDTLRPPASATSPGSVSLMTQDCPNLLRDLVGSDGPLLGDPGTDKCFLPKLDLLGAADQGFH